MADPGKSVSAQIHYELQLIIGPRTITFRGETIDVESGIDLPAIVRIVVHGDHLISRDIVGIIADEGRNGARSFLDLRRFLVSGGVIGISKELQ